MGTGNRETWFSKKTRSSERFFLASFQKHYLKMVSEPKVQTGISK